MDRLFDEGFSRPWRFLPTDHESTFPVEVGESEQEIEVKAALPGMRPEDVDISIANDVLTIKGEHKDVTEDKGHEYYRREIRYGSFHRSLSLPVSVDADKAEASFENGMLVLRLPKAEALRPKQIRINGATAKADKDV
jgi:HSP20 family protein